MSRGARGEGRVIGDVGRPARGASSDAREPVAEPLEVLMPELSDAARGRAGRMMNLLRLLRADGAASASPRTAIPIDRVRSELARQDAEGQASALEDLLRHHLAAHLGAESFVWAGEPRRGVQDAWRALAEEARRGGASPVGLPEPGESALSVARRLVEGIERLGPREGLGLWRARLERAGVGARAGEAAFRALLEGDAGAQASALRGRRAALAGLCECLLDRGAVGQALELLSERPRWVGADARLGWLLTWTLLVRGEFAAAEDARAGLEPWRGPLPAALAALRGHFPAAAAALPGRVGPPPTGSAPGPLRDRRDLGASVLALFRFEADGGARPLWLDVAPGLRADLEAWLDDRLDAHQDPLQPEHSLVIEAAPQILHGARARPPEGALGARSVALAQVPLLDATGEVGGWLHVECEHHLLPSPTRLEQLAQAWRGALGDPSILLGRSELAGATPSHAPPGGEGLESAPEPDRSLLAGVFRRLVDVLAFKTSRRRWWGIEVCDGELRAVCEGGEGLSSLPGTGGGGRALERCRSTGGVVCFDDGDERLRLHPDAVSGVALPIGVRGEVHGILVVESVRRRDFSARDVERMAAIAGAFGLALRIGQFRAWHLARFGLDLHFDPSRRGLARFVEHLIAAGRSHEPVVLSGERGVGKLVLARWVHFERGGGAGSLRSISCRSPGELDLTLPPGTSNASLLLEGMDELSAAGQAQLAAHLSTPTERRAPLIATSRLPMGTTADAGQLRVELADSLARMEVLVPPLRRRREEIPGLVRFLSRRFAVDERVPVPQFEESAMGLLWRQPWEGNVRELESLVFKLVLAADGEAVTADGVRAIALRSGHELWRKLPSRHPLRADLVAALRSTVTGGGRTNKCRAAAFLGWDPDTLCARLADAHLGEASLVEEPFPWDAPLA